MIDKSNHIKAGFKNTDAQSFAFVSATSMLLYMIICAKGFYGTEQKSSAEVINAAIFVCASINILKTESCGVQKYPAGLGFCHAFGSGLRQKHGLELSVIKRGFAGSIKL